jgi:hypothetical protein
MRNSAMNQQAIAKEIEIVTLDDSSEEEDAIAAPSDSIQQEAKTASMDDLIKYIVDFVACSTGESNKSLIEDACRAAPIIVNSFIKHDSSKALFVNRLVQPDNASFFYKVTEELNYDEAQTLAICFVKQGPTIVADKHFGEQFLSYG